MNKLRDVMSSRVNKNHLNNYFQLNVDAQEGILAMWLTFVGATTAAALIFHHNANDINTKNVIPKNISAFLACGLLLSATALNIFCIYNFVERTNFIIIMADKKDKFSIKKINHSQIIYLLFGGIIVLVQLIIVYFIFKNSFQKFL